MVSWEYLNGQPSVCDGISSVNSGDRKSTSISKNYKTKHKFSSGKKVGMIIYIPIHSKMKGIQILFMMKLKLLNSHILIINTRKLIPRELKKVRENKITTKNNTVSRKKGKFMKYRNKK